MPTELAIFWVCWNSKLNKRDRDIERKKWKESKQRNQCENKWFYLILLWALKAYELECNNNIAGMVRRILQSFTHSFKWYWLECEKRIMCSMLILADNFVDSKHRKIYFKPQFTQSIYGDCLCDALAKFSQRNHKTLAHLTFGSFTAGKSRKKKKNILLWWMVRTEHSYINQFNCQIISTKDEIRLFL